MKDGSLCRLIINPATDESPVASSDNYIVQAFVAQQRAESDFDFAKRTKEMTVKERENEYRFD